MSNSAAVSMLMIAIGLAMLLVGRQFYAIFCAGMGFLLGGSFPFLLPFTPSGWSMFFIPAVFALIFGAAAFILRRRAAAIIGVVAGYYITQNFLVALGGENPPFIDWISLVVGIICLVVLWIWFDVAMVILSTTTGAMLLAEYMHTDVIPPPLMFLIFVVFGLISQFVLLQYGSRSPD